MVASIIQTDDADNADMRTHILQAVMTLTATKSLDELSVKDICDEAYVSRRTFYNYFTDKYDVVSWFFQSTERAHISAIGRTETWYDAIFFVAETVSKFQLFAQGINDSRKLVKQSSAIIWEEELIRTVTDYKKVPLTEELRYQIGIWSRTITEEVGIWKYGVLDDCSVAQFSRILEDCVPRTLHDLLSVDSEGQ